MPTIEAGLALGAGIGLLLARVMHFDIGLSLVLGAVAGITGVFPSGDRERHGSGQTGD